MLKSEQVLDWFVKCFYVNRYSTFVNWELWWPNFPILVYFKETQTKPEGQIHFFPVIFVRLHWNLVFCLTQFTSLSELWILFLGLCSFIDSVPFYYKYKCVEWEAIVWCYGGKMWPFKNQWTKRLTKSLRWQRQQRYEMKYKSIVSSFLVR